MALKLEIKPLTPDLADVLVNHLGGLSFDHAPHWASCFCRFYHTDCDMAHWKLRSAEDNRQDALAAIQSGQMKGYLAFEGNGCIGWLNANDSTSYIRLKDELASVTITETGTKKVGVVICYVIHPNHRRKGVAKALLERAISDFRVQAYDGVIALPIDHQESVETSYRGTMSMYTYSGFKEIQRHGDLSVMWLGLEGYQETVLWSPQLQKNRKIRIWCPKGYDAQGTKRYPVIYMHDGQNLFDRATSAYGDIWDVHTCMEGMQKEGLFQGAIVVGIDNAEGLQRLDEYSPWVSQEAGILKGLPDSHPHVGGQGEAYAAFVVETVKPYIDTNFYTLPEREATWVMGSSMGAFISLYLGIRYPHVFSRIGAFSTAAWFAQSSLLDAIERVDLQYDIRWYLDVGTNETSNPDIPDFNQRYVDGTVAVGQALVAQGVPKSHVSVVIEAGGIHNEKDWARRLPSAIQWLNHEMV